MFFVMEYSKYDIKVIKYPVYKFSSAKLAGKATVLRRRVVRMSIRALRGSLIKIVFKDSTVLSRYVERRIQKSARFGEKRWLVGCTMRRTRTATACFIVLS